MDAKVWWKSRTMWLNILAFIGSIGSYFVPGVPLSTTILGIVAGAVGVAMRSVTGQPVTLTDTNATVAK